MRVLWPARVAAILVLSLASEPAFADARADSRAAFESGAKAFDNGRVEDARALFRKAYELFPHFSTLYNLGLCERALGRPVEAASAFRQFLADGGAKVPPAQRKAVTDLLKEVEGKVSKLDLRVTPEAAKLVLDGKSARPGEQSVNPGEHVIEATAEGHASVRKQVTVGSGSVTHVDLSLTPAVAPAAPAPPPTASSAAAPVAAAPAEAPSRLGVGFWTAASVGAAGLLTAGITGAIAISDSRAYNDLSTPEEEAQRRKSRGRTMLVVADVGLGVAAVGGVVAVLFALRDPAPSSSALRVSPQLGPGSVGLGALGVF